MNKEVFHELWIKKFSMNIVYVESFHEQSVYKYFPWTIYMKVFHEQHGSDSTNEDLSINIVQRG